MERSAPRDPSLTSTLPASVRGVDRRSRKNGPDGPPPPLIEQRGDRTALPTW